MRILKSIEIDRNLDFGFGVVGLVSAVCLRNLEKINLCWNSLESLPAGLTTSAP
jgi:hypothetical protein